MFARNSFSRSLLARLASGRRVGFREVVRSVPAPEELATSEAAEELTTSVASFMIDLASIMRWHIGIKVVRGLTYIAVGLDDPAEGFAKLSPSLSAEPDHLPLQRYI